MFRREVPIEHDTITGSQGTRSFDTLEGKQERNCVYVTSSSSLSDSLGVYRKQSATGLRVCCPHTEERKLHGIIGHRKAMISFFVHRVELGLVYQVPPRDASRWEKYSGAVPPPHGATSCKAEEHTSHSLTFSRSPTSSADTTLALDPVE